jgi:hypothetical protein
MRDSTRRVSVMTPFGADFLRLSVNRTVSVQSATGERRELTVHKVSCGVYPSMERGKTVIVGQCEPGFGPAGCRRRRDTHRPRSRDRPWSDQRSTPRQSRDHDRDPQPRDGRTACGGLAGVCVHLANRCAEPETSAATSGYS